MTLYEMGKQINHDSEIIEKIKSIVDDTIDHLNHDDAFDMLYNFSNGGRNEFSKS